MPVFRPRTRLVNFRLSEDEYHELKAVCANSGARSVSDYARSAVLAVRTDEPKLAVAPSLIAHEEAGCQSRWDRLEGVVQQLEARMRQLMQQGAPSSDA